ncbi:MAG: hypothetical protein EBY46_00275 [Rhodobacteraceae bacterium]|nr:hypothetical protein [Paracoccaceae bacterium]
MQSNNLPSFFTQIATDSQYLILVGDDLPTSTGDRLDDNEFWSSQTNPTHAGDQRPG